MNKIDKFLKWIGVQENFIYMMSIVFLAVFLWVGQLPFLWFCVCVVISTLFWQMIRSEFSKTKVRCKKDGY